MYCSGSGSRGHQFVPELLATEIWANSALRAAKFFDEFSEGESTYDEAMCHEMVNRYGWMCGCAIRKWRDIQ